MLINTYVMPIEVKTFSMKITVCRSNFKQRFQLFTEVHIHHIWKPIGIGWIFIINFFLHFLFFQILVRHRLTYVYSDCSNPQNNTVECISGCTGIVITNANCTESNLAENWADFEGETIFDIRHATSSHLGLRFVNYNHAWMKHPFCFIKKDNFMYLYLIYIKIYVKIFYFWHCKTVFIHVYEILKDILNVNTHLTFDDFFFKRF